MSDNTKPMRMKWSFVIQMARGSVPWAKREHFNAIALAQWASADAQRDLFPNGMTPSEAQWILAHPDAFTDGEP